MRYHVAIERQLDVSPIASVTGDAEILQRRLRRLGVSGEVRRRGMTELEVELPGYRGDAAALARLRGALERSGRFALLLVDDGAGLVPSLPAISSPIP